MSDTIDVMEATSEDFPRISGCLAEAFFDDPIAVFLFPNERARRARLSSLYRFVLAAMSSHGRVVMDRDARGAAIWQAPSPPTAGPVEEAIGKVMLAAVLRSASVRAMALNRAATEAQPAEGYWYLGILGTAPAHQGSGIASALMTPTLAHCDEMGLRAYLESSKQDNIPFYERHGFRVTGEVRIEDGPLLWPMIRPPAQ
jgi:ribosomal protein S18 acetylase RimI-like enzyme